MNGLSLTGCLLFYAYATITCDEENYTKLYKEIYKTTFKKFYKNHKESFNVPTYKNGTKTFNQIWVLKTNQLNPKVSRQIKRDISSTTPFPEGATYAMPKREIRNPKWPRQKPLK